MRLHPAALASLLAVSAFSAAALADDPPPGPAPDTAEGNFEAFMAAWQKIVVRIPPGTVRTFGATATDGAVDVTGTVEVAAYSPADGVIAFHKTIKLEHQENLEAKHVMLPPILAVKEWSEPLPVMLPDHAAGKFERDVELKVGEKTLKCSRLTLTLGDDKSAPEVVSTWWICEQDGLGLVRVTALAGKDKKMDLVLTSWKVPAK